MPSFSENKIIFDNRFYDLYDEVEYLFLVTYADEFAYDRFRSRYKEALDKLRYINKDSGRFFNYDIKGYKHVKIRGYKYVLIYKYDKSKREVHILEIQYARKDLMKLLRGE